MTDQIQPGTDVITEDRACVGCGYNLRGLASDGCCPECGNRVAKSLRGSLLKHSDADWLDRLRFGASLKLWNILVGIVSGIGAGALTFLGFPRAIMALVGIAGGALGLWASFAITTQEPRISLNEDTVTLRKVVRFCASLAFFGSFTQHAERGGDWGVVIAVVGGCLAFVGLVATFGEFVYFRRFALRIPDEKLAKSTKTLMWAVPGTVAVATILRLVVVFAGTTQAMTATVGGTSTTVTTMQANPSAAVPAAVLGASVCFVVVMGLVLFIWYIRLLMRYKDAFQVAAEVSRSQEISPASSTTDPPPSES